MITTPQASAFRPPDHGVAALMRRITALERRVNELTGANILAAAGIKVTSEGMTIDSALAVAGELSLPAGIIDNAALAAPTAHGSSGSSQNDFAITTSQSLVAAGTITVPPGFTKMTIMVVSTASGVNSTAAAAFLWVAAYINTGPGATTQWSTEAGKVGTGAASAIRTLTGLAGGEVFTVGTLISAPNGTWARSTLNSANCDAIALFTR